MIRTTRNYHSYQNYDIRENLASGATGDAYDPTLFQKVTSPRLIYSFNQSHYITRGSSLASGGQRQYVGMTKALCGKEFFRGRGYSTGEDYFHEKSRGIGKNATNGTIVKPSIVAHITYMVLGA